MKTPDFDRNRDNQLNDRNRLVQFLKTQVRSPEAAQSAPPAVLTPNQERMVGL